MVTRCVLPIHATIRQVNPSTRGSPSPIRDPNLYLAAERTFLSWVRTGLSMMGFGFVLARFGVFLRETHAGSSQAVSSPTGISSQFGITLVLLGVLTNLASAVRYTYLIK